MTSTSTIPAALNDAFIQVPTAVVATTGATVATTATTTAAATATTTTAATTAASARPYEYCQCYGTFVAEVDKPDIDVLIFLAQEIHGPTEAILPHECCPCPVCVGHLGQCDECDGLYLVKDEDETEEYDEYEEDGLRDYIEDVSDIEESPSHPKTTRLFMDLEEIEESMAQVVLSSKYPT